MSKRANTIFHFKLTARQAQTVYDVCACLMEEPAFKEIWRTKDQRNRVRVAVRRFDRQLNRQYELTGVEV